MKKNRICVQLLTILCLITRFGILSAQTDQLVQNGGFENGNGYPTDQNQLSSKCSFWNTVSSTPDWYTTNNYLGAYRGGCPIEYGTNEEIFNAQPKISTYDGSNYYAGFGSSEILINKLTRKTYPFSKIKISFWFMLRGSTFRYSWVNEEIGANLRIIENGTSHGLKVFSTLVFKGDVPQYSACTWNYFESDWIDTDGYEYNELIIGGGGNNPAGMLNENGYIYIDDVKLYNGKSCCPNNISFQNTSALPPISKAKSIVAGTNSGLSGVKQGPVTILSNQNITFKADKIYLNSGFSVQQGAVFNAINEACTPFTAPSGASINVITIPNVFTPNGDGVNDLFCANVTGATEYRIKIYNRYGDRLYYDASEVVNGNYVCMWNGANVSDGTYYYIITFKNCTESISKNGYVDVFHSSARLTTINETFSINNNNHLQHFEIFPNPSDGHFSLIIPEEYDDFYEVIIYNSLGQRVVNTLGNQKLLPIDISASPKGFYYIKLISPSDIFVKKILYQ